MLYDSYTGAPTTIMRNLDRRAAQGYRPRSRHAGKRSCT
jgi:hypothetical protein